MLRRYATARVVQGRLKKGEDLIEGLQAVMKEHNITAGVVTGIGAVSSARIACLNQQTKQYEEKVFQEALEVVSLRGNVSLKEGSVFVHLHVALSRADFSVVGGHLLSGSPVYAFEFEILCLEGEPFTRHFDEETGLFLWKE